MGDRPEITVASAEPWLGDAAGRLSTNGRVGPKVALTTRSKVPFARYREQEIEIISQLLALRDPATVLAQRPLGKLTGMRFDKVAEKLREERDGTAYGEALVWFGNGIAAAAGKKLELAPRPWEGAFDKAQARSKKTSAEVVLADWLADLVWSLDWVFSTRSFEAGRRELVTLHAVALEIVNRLVRSRVRPDRAAAEAVTIVELSRQSQIWEEVQAAL
jgi:hypothetical protein